MRIFLKKSCKYRFSVGGSDPNPRLPPAVGGSAPNSRVVVTPACYCNFVEFVSCAKCVLLSSKRNKLTTVNALFLLLPHFLHLFFTSSSVFFVDGGRGWGRKNISCLRALATPLPSVTLQQKSKLQAVGTYQRNL